MSAMARLSSLGLQATGLLEANRQKAAFGPALAAGAGCFVGLATAVVMARGPVTTDQALAVIASGLALGIAAGLAWSSRWGIVLAFVAYTAAFEIFRHGTVGPTVDTVRLDNMFGIIGFVITRVVQSLLLGLPLVTGNIAGRVLGRRLARRPTTPHGLVRTVLGLVPGGLSVLLTAGFAIVVALPPTAPPVLGADGKPIPGSIAELTTVRLGGVDQSIAVRAADPDKPVLLYLSGGPGQSDIALSRVYAQPWVHDFVFVDWDQRGNGKSYAAIDPVGTFTLDQAVSDTIELTNYLRDRFGEKRIYLMGESWGTILGVLAVQKRPDLYYAYIGSGQMVDLLETDKRIYHDLVAYARRTGDTGLATQLADMGEPPYHDIPWANSNLLAWYDYLYKPYTPSAGYESRQAGGGLDPFGMLGSEYSFIEKMNVLRGLLDTFSLMYPQLYGIDFRRDVPRLEVPVYILDGTAELDGRRDLMLEWFDKLQAPVKERIEFANAAHAVAFEQADEVLKLLAGEIVPQTYGR